MFQFTQDFFSSGRASAAPSDPANGQQKAKEDATKPANEDANYAVPGGPPLTRSFSSFYIPNVDSKAREPQTGPTRTKKTHRGRRSYGLKGDDSVHLSDSGAHEPNDSPDVDNGPNPTHTSHTSTGRKRDEKSRSSKSSTSHQKSQKKQEAGAQPAGQMPKAKPTYFDEMLRNAQRLEKERFEKENGKPYPEFGRVGREIPVNGWGNTRYDTGFRPGGFGSQWVSRHPIHDRNYRV